MSTEDSITSGPDSRYAGLKSASASQSGPLSKLYANKFAYQFLQYPLNLESVEQDHWVRFDIQKIQGVGIRTDQSRDSATKSAAGETKTFLQRVTEGTAEKFSAGAERAKELAITQARRQASSAADSLPPALAGITKNFIQGAGRVQGLGSIMLFAPQSRSESMGTKWTPEEIGQSGAIFATGLNQGQLTGDALDAALASAPVKFKDTVTKIASNLAGNPQLEEVFHRSHGAAINPQLEMFFKGIDMRTFTFEFKMAPRNAPEARAIKDIVQLFKFASAPGLSESLGQHFDYPEVFDITFSNQEQTHKIAQSALTNVSVTHGADGVNTTFYDGYPVETAITLTFTELEIMHKGMIEKGY